MAGLQEEALLKAKCRFQGRLGLHHVEVTSGAARYRKAWANTQEQHEGKGRAYVTEHWAKAR